MLPVIPDNRLKVMTVDVEDYFQVAAFDKQISPEQWGNYPLRVESNTHRILDMFAQTGAKATFFTLGWVAERLPALIHRIVQEGHELGSHGFGHQKAFLQSRKDFESDVRSSKHLLEDLSGQPVLGYRAPSFSIDKRNEWAFDVLREAGYVYSSSTYPVVHDHYGTPDWPVAPYQLSNGLWELPQSTIDKWGRRLPVGGGGYFRLFPLPLSEYLIRTFHEQHGHPYIFYFHPWEIDPLQPRIADAPLKSKFRHYVNLARMEGKIRSLCEAHQWHSIRDAYSFKAGHRGRAR